MCVPLFPSGSDSLKTTLSLFTSLSRIVLREDASQSPDLLAASLSYSHPRNSGGPGSAHSPAHTHPEKSCPSSQTGPSQFWRLPSS